MVVSIAVDAPVALVDAVAVPEDAPAQPQEANAFWRPVDSVMPRIHRSFFTLIKKIKENISMAINLKNENNFLNITITQSCNLACSYCYENHKSKKTISFNDAKNILDKHLIDFSDDTYIEVDLFGGEPLVAFERIKEIVEYAEDKKYTDHCFFCLVTNGTLVHGEIKKWLLEHRNHVTCALSLDGTRESHNINRSNSFDMIDLDFFANNYYQNPIKMTISADTLSHLCENIVFCHTKGFEVSCNLAYGIDWSDEKMFLYLKSS